jgi:hypothetical protein
MTPTALAKDALDPGRRSSFPESLLVETVDSKSETLAGILSRKRRDHRFCLVLATLAAITIFSGFSATYYLKPLRGLVPLPASSQLPMVIHLHGAVFTLYVLFYLFQTALISRGQRALHMTLGWVSIALIPAMVVLGTMAAFWGASMGHMQNWPDLESAAMVNVMSVFVFAVIATVGILLRKKPEAHKRLMSLSFMTLLPPALARPTLASLLGPAGVVAAIFAFILAGSVYDLITRRRIHPAYILGVIFFIIAGPPVRLAIGATPAWHHFVHWAIRQ